MKATHSKLILTLCLILNITFFMTVSEIAYGGDSEESTDEQKPRVINVHQTESTSTDDVDVLREDIQDAPPKLIDILMGRLELHLAKRRVLALDGGGMRGAFTIKVLAQLEQDTELPIGELFKG
ncbi:MAG: hypothetical protein HOI80_03560, partial [Alphaproteobacteria bacterium]|nr:hypothetical protein [Alphaproteobacteria bacterium]